MNENEKRDRKGLTGYLPMVEKQLQVIDRNLQQYRDRQGFLRWEEVYDFLLLMRYVRQAARKLSRLQDGMVGYDNAQEGLLTV